LGYEVFDLLMVEGLLPVDDRIGLRWMHFNHRIVADFPNCPPPASRLTYVATS